MNTNINYSILYFPNQFQIKKKSFDWNFNAIFDFLENEY